MQIHNSIRFLVKRKSGSGAVYSAQRTDEWLSQRNVQILAALRFDQAPAGSGSLPDRTLVGQRIQSADAQGSSGQGCMPEQSPPVDSSLLSGHYLTGCSSQSADEQASTAAEHSSLPEQLRPADTSSQLLGTLTGGCSTQSANEMGSTAAEYGSVSEHAMLADEGLQVDHKCLAGSAQSADLCAVTGIPGVASASAHVNHRARQHGLCQQDGTGPPSPHSNPPPCTAAGISEQHTGHVWHLNSQARQGRVQLTAAADAPQVEAHGSGSRLVTRPNRLLEAGVQDVAETMRRHMHSEAPLHWLPLSAADPNRMCGPPSPPSGELLEQLGLRLDSIRTTASLQTPLHAPAPAATAAGAGDARYRDLQLQTVQVPVSALEPSLPNKLYQLGMYQFSSPVRPSQTQSPGELPPGRRSVHLSGAWCCFQFNARLPLIRVWLKQCDSVHTDDTQLG